MMTDPSHPSPDEALIEELEKLHEAATTAPWCEHPNGTSVWSGAEYDNNCMSANAHLLNASSVRLAEKFGVADVALVVAMRNALPTLLALARSASEAKARLERLESALEFLDVHCRCDIVGQERALPINARNAIALAVELGWTGKAGT
jgi:hypothetical protein